MRTLLLRELERYYRVEVDAEDCIARMALIIHNDLNDLRSHEPPRNSGLDPDLGETQPELRGSQADVTKR